MGASPERYTLYTWTYLNRGCPYYDDTKIPRFVCRTPRDTTAGRRNLGWSPTLEQLNNPPDDHLHKTVYNVRSCNKYNPLLVMYTIIHSVTNNGLFVVRILQISVGYCWILPSVCSVTTCHASRRPAPTHDAHLVFGHVNSRPLI
jgi:hypothetical protein